MLPPHLVQRLTPEERRSLFALPFKKRLETLKKRFPDFDWKSLEDHMALRKELDEKLRGVPPFLMRRIRRMPKAKAIEALSGHFGGDDAKAREIIELLEKERKMGPRHRRPEGPRRPDGPRRPRRGF